MRVRVSGKRTVTSTESRLLVEVIRNDSLEVANYSGVEAIFANTSAFIITNSTSRLDLCRDNVALFGFTTT